MSTIKDEALKLPREERIDLFHALQSNLQWDNDLMENEGLTAEHLAELQARESLLNAGEIKWISKDEFDDFLKKRRHAI